MSDVQRKAWQPLTFNGVAKFAHASFWRLLLVELCTGLIVAGVVIWFVSTRYAPVIDEALLHIPDEAELNQGKLSGIDSGLLADSKFLSFTVDLEGVSESGTADIEVRFVGDGFDVSSLLGYASFYYPESNAPVGRSILEPWWGAWKPVVVAGFGALSIIVLIIAWPALAFIYSPIAKLLAYFGDRELPWKAARRLCCAAQLPAALFACLIIALYGLQVLDLIRFLFFYAMHFFVALIYICISVFFTERPAGTSALKTNPFTSTSGADGNKV